MLRCAGAVAVSNMSVSTFQKITIVSCGLLCVALLLPKMLLSRGNRDSEGPAGQFPPMPHRASVSEEQRQSSRVSSRAHNPEAIARAKGTGAGAGGKSNLAGQIIPIYGFGILLYILYILFKITSKGKTTQLPESRFTSVRSQNTQRKITDFELAQLQDRLNETKDVIERIISSASIGTDSAGAAVALDEEQQLLQQLQEITRVMQEGRLVDSIPGNTGDTRGQQWDDLPDNNCNEHFCCVHSHDMTRKSGGPDEKAEEPVSDHEVTTDANRNTKTREIPAPESISQSQPETDARTGSDITPGPASEHSAIRRRNK